jgi:hypothetical protein
MTSWADFEKIQVPHAPSGEKTESFCAAIGARGGEHWMARDCHGYPCLIVAAPTEEGGETRLEHLRIQISVPCEIQASDNTVRATLTVLRCTSSIEEHQRLFVSLIDPIIDAIGQPPTSEKLRSVIQQLVAMFSSLSQPARTTVQGLWGELLVVANSRDPSRMLKAWHATTGDDFDFSEGTWRLEVKTSSAQVREHTFRLNQLRAATGTAIRIASLIVRPAGAGAAIATLVGEIETALHNEPILRLKLHRLTVDTLGAEWKDAADCRFDRELAENSLGFYCAESVPQILGELPAGVSHVSFVSNLVSAPLAPSPAEGSLFEAAKPAHRAGRKVSRVK